MRRILITGANGFVGKHLCKRLINEVKIRGTILNGESVSSLLEDCEPVFIPPIGPETEWSNALQDVDAVIHLAARVHVMQEKDAEPLKEFRLTNTAGTERLAYEAAAAGVRRIVFISTVGINGNNSGDKPYAESDQPHPHNPYSISKYEAELALRKISHDTGMEVVIIRAPLAYGPGNPGNFLSLLRIVSKGIPLPLASTVNKRSMIYVGNLVDALTTCAVHPAASGQTYLVSDGEDVSTPELIRRTAAVLGVPVRLFPVPMSLVLLAGKLTGKSGAVNSLTGSLTVDTTKIRRELGWKPSFTLEEGLAETARWFNRQKEIDIDETTL